TAPTTFPSSLTLLPPPPLSPLFPYTTLFRSRSSWPTNVKASSITIWPDFSSCSQGFSSSRKQIYLSAGLGSASRGLFVLFFLESDRKSTRLNSSHLVISYAVFCLKKKTT